MSWWKRRKKSKLEDLCHVCGVNQMPAEPAIIRLKVEGGVAEMHVCDECADFFDQTAEVLLKGRKNDESV